MKTGRVALASSAVMFAIVTAACGDSFHDTPASSSDGGSGGVTGDASTGGSGGSQATGGAAGSSATGGEAGSAGAAGVAGSAGEAGNAGTAGTAGSAGSSPEDAGTDADACTTTADCDHDPSNGCETPIDTVDNCGACGVVCSPSNNALPTCSNAVCGLQCVSGFADCDGDKATGCEVKLDTTSNCGMCGNACGTTNGAASCDQGTCKITCAAGYTDCNGTNSDGCEIHTSSDVSNCGACGRACGTTNGTASCDTGTCKITCNTGYTDCNGTNSDGCEIHTSADVLNCGTCGLKCGTTNGTPSCTSGACSILCNTNYADCNGTNADGCEVNLTNDKHNCGACGHDCGGGTCNNGLCTAWVLATEPSAPQHIALYGNNIYWTLSNAIRSVAKTGGTVSSVVWSVTNASDLAIDASGLYWLEFSTSGKVRHTQLQGIIITEVDTTGPNVPQRIALNSGDVFWTVAGFLAQKSKSGGLATLLASSYASLAPVEVYNDTTVVFATTKLGGGIHSVPVGGGTIRTVAGGDYIQDFALSSAGGVYFAPRDGKLYRASLSGGFQFTLATGLNQPVAGIAADDKSVFYTEFTAGNVQQLGLLAGVPVTRFHNGDSLTQVLSDGTMVFFIDSTANKIYAMVK